MLAVNHLIGFGASTTSAATTAPTFQSKGTAGVATATPVSPSYPASIAANDLIILAVCIAHSTSTPTVTTPSGFTLIQETALGSGTDRHSLHVYYKIAAGSESGALAVTIGGLAGANVVAIAQLYRLTGINTSSPYESNSMTSEWTSVADVCTGIAEPYTTPSITPGGTGRRLVIITGFDNSGFDSNQAGTLPAVSWVLNAVDSTTTGGDASIRFMSIDQSTPYTGSASRTTQDTAAATNDGGDGYSFGMALIGL